MKEIIADDFTICIDNNYIGKVTLSSYNIIQSGVNPIEHQMIIYHGTNLVLILIGSSFEVDFEKSEINLIT